MTADKIQTPFRLLVVVLIGLIQIPIGNADDDHTFPFNAPPASEPLYSISGLISFSTQSTISPDDILPSWNTVDNQQRIGVIARNRKNRYGGGVLVTKDKWQFTINGLPEGTYDLAIMCYEVPYISRIGYFIDRSSDELNVMSDKISKGLFNCIVRYTEARNTALSELNEDSVKSSDTVTDDYFDRESKLVNEPFSNARYRSRAIAELAKPNGKITTASEERCVLEVYGTETTAYAFCLVNLRSILRDLDLEVDNFLFERLDLVLQNGDWKIKSRDGIESDIFAPSKNGPYVYKGYVHFELSGNLVGIKVGPDTRNVVLSPPIELLPVTTLHNNQWIGKKVETVEQK